MRTCRLKAFTLVELLIVVSILGILAAIVLPEFQGHAKQAKESQAKANLRVFREAIELYAAEHNGVAPGYFMNNSSLTPSGGNVKIQLISDTKPYLQELPTNPFNNLAALLVLDNNASIPAEPTQTGSYGWVYKPASKILKLNWIGTDSTGNAYYNY